MWESERENGDGEGEQRWRERRELTVMESANGDGES